MKIVVTGATGFLGSHLVKKFLQEKHQVYSIVRESTRIDELEKLNIDYYCYDGKLEGLIEYFKNIKPDIVIHTATYFVAEHQWRQVDALLKSNVIFSTHLLEAMFQSGVNKLINTATTWEHYQGEDYNPVCLYAATKRMAEDMMRYYVEAHDMQIITLALYDTYGMNDTRGKLLQKLIEISKTGEQLCMSDGEQEIALLYIDDVTEAFCIALNEINTTSTVKYTKYYLLPQEIYSLRKTVQILENVLQTQLNIQWGVRAYRKREVMKVYNKGEALPNWEAKVTLEDGFKRLVEVEQ